MRMLEHLEGSSEDWYVHSDELGLARRVMFELYDIAGLKPPAWWLKRPVEKVNDDQAYQWLDMLNKEVVEFRIAGDEVVVRSLAMERNGMQRQKNLLQLQFLRI